MLKKSNQNARIFLENLKCDQSRSTFSSLERLLNELENKPDPEPNEIRLVESIYSFIEKYKLLENNISVYVRENTPKQSGSKLSELYEQSNKIGSSVLFD